MNTTRKTLLCIPVMPIDYQQLGLELMQLENINFELLELRLDYFKDEISKNNVEKMITTIKKQLPNTDIIATIRTKKHGGKKVMTNKEYTQAIEMIAELEGIDFIDLEFQDRYEQDLYLSEAIKNRKKKVIISYHDIIKTPSKEELKEIFIKMEHLKPEVVKIVTTANSHHDTINVIDTAFEITNTSKQKKLIIAMSDYGKITRLASDLLGNYFTFAKNNTASASGQIDCKLMNQILEVLEN